MIPLHLLLIRQWISFLSLDIAPVIGSTSTPRQPRPLPGEIRRRSALHNPYQARKILFLPLFYVRRHPSPFPVHSYTPLSIKATFSFKLPFRAVFWEAKLSFFVGSSDRNTPTSLKLLLNYQQRPTTHPVKYFPLPDNSSEAQRRIPAA